MSTGYGTGTTIEFTSLGVVANVLSANPRMSRGKHNRTNMATTVHEDWIPKNLVNTTMVCRIQWDPDLQEDGEVLALNNPAEELTVTWAGQTMAITGIAFIETVEPEVQVEEYMEATINIQFQTAQWAVPGP